MDIPRGSGRGSPIAGRMLAQEKSASQEIKIKFRTAKLVNPAGFVAEQACNPQFRHFP
jgi:hypothetical protein